MPPTETPATTPPTPSTPAEPALTPTAPTAAKPHAPAGRIILQWMTYALWGWSLLALAALTFLVYFSLLYKNTDVSGLLPYALAATGVLVIGAFVCDLFYRKQEPTPKHGFEMVIMIIHAVIFALFSIGSIVATIISLLTLLLSVDSTATRGTLASVLSWGTVAVLYAIIFLRTLNPPKLAARRLPFITNIAMLIATIVFMTLALTGPLFASISSRQDRRIETHLGTVQQAVSSYASANKKLPDSLSSLTLADDAKQLVADGLVEYKKDPATATELRYQLCVTYTSASDHAGTAQYFPADQQEYKPYLPSTTPHDKGRTCYKLAEYIYTGDLTKPDALPTKTTN